MSFDFNRVERLIRSRILGSPFVATSLLTRFEVFGRENLLRAIERSKEHGTGLVTYSNHQSLFDDPIVLLAILGLRDFTVESKVWWSTPCQSNFYPEGKSLRTRFVRYFSDVSNMIFISRKGKTGRLSLPSSYLSALNERGEVGLVEKILTRAAARGLGGGETYLRRFVTEGDTEHLAPFNQVGMVEACARLDLGDWLHFFPEGGRCRTLDLKPPKAGMGKALYHCREAEFLPICFCGMQDVLPIRAAVPRPFRRVVVFVGEPVSTRRFDPLRSRPATPELYQELVHAAWEPVQSLWPLALARHERLKVSVTSSALRTADLVDGAERLREAATGRERAMDRKGRELPAWGALDPRAAARAGRPRASGQVDLPRGP
jgi:1-acyl-sn-glycerol-3-phosphate acyltransferase